MLVRAMERQAAAAAAPAPIVVLDDPMQERGNLRRRYDDEELDGEEEVPPPPYQVEDPNKRRRIAINSVKLDGYGLTEQLGKLLHLLTSVATSAQVVKTNNLRLLDIIKTDQVFYLLENNVILYLSIAKNFVLYLVRTAAAEIVDRSKVESDRSWLVRDGGVRIGLHFVSYTFNKCRTLNNLTCSIFGNLQGGDDAVVLYYGKRFISQHNVILHWETASPGCYIVPQPSENKMIDRNTRRVQLSEQLKELVVME